MEKLRWDKNMSVHNSMIDNQHKELFDLINKLISHSNADIKSPIIGETLRDLLKYTRRHFKDEEKLLKDANYPHLEEHRKMHMDFIYKIAMFCKDVMDCKPSIIPEMIEYLSSWLQNHTSTADLDFKNYLEK